MSPNTENIEAKLCAYIDGELDAAARAEIEKHLEANPQHRLLIADLMTQRNLLRDLPVEAAPMELREAIEHQMERAMLLSGIDDDVGAKSMKIRRWPQVFALAAMVLLTIGLGVVVYQVVTPPEPHMQITMAPPATAPVGLETDASEKLTETSPLASVARSRAEPEGVDALAGGMAKDDAGPRIKLPTPSEILESRRAAEGATEVAAAPVPVVRTEPDVAIAPATVASKNELPAVAGDARSVPPEASAVAMAEAPATPLPSAPNVAAAPADAAPGATASDVAVASAPLPAQVDEALKPLAITPSLVVAENDADTSTRQLLDRANVARRDDAPPVVVTLRASDAPDLDTRIAAVLRGSQLTWDDGTPPALGAAAAMALAPAAQPSEEKQKEEPASVLLKANAQQQYNVQQQYNRIEPPTVSVGEKKEAAAGSQQAVQINVAATPTESASAPATPAKAPPDDAVAGIAPGKNAPADFAAPSTTGTGPRVFVVRQIPATRARSIAAEIENLKQPLLAEAFGATSASLATTTAPVEDKLAGTPATQPAIHPTSPNEAHALADVVLPSTAPTASAVPELSPERTSPAAPPTTAESPLVDLVIVLQDPVVAPIPTDMVPGAANANSPVMRPSTLPSSIP